jgi:hypothetical protein
MLATLPSCRMLASVVPACGEGEKPGKICQHSRTDEPFCAETAVMLRKVGGTNGMELYGVAMWTRLSWTGANYRGLKVGWISWKNKWIVQTGGERGVCDNLK